MAKAMASSKTRTGKAEAEQPTKPRTATGKRTKAAVQAVVEAPKARRRRSGEPVAAAAPAPAPAPVPRRRRSNRRSEQTVDNIFAATQKVVLESGAERISILEVCETAGVSRGTFYRYFSSQDELLEAYSRHSRERFHRTLSELLAPYTDPNERLAGLIRYLQEFLDAGTAQRMLVVAPEFALRFLKRIFHDSVVRFQDLLAPVFDAWDEELGVKLDRELICDLLIRLVMSELLVSGESEGSVMPRRIGRLVDALRFGGVTRARR
ncbi:TetR/AcrR family transcriptional regulator [Burkholderia multivorans]|uniref:TetR/AcrR family transcriptional regulator n=2 Tax=Burkholderia multivorans TaxID=87883 RepID=UPI000D00F84C|nr:TetR/AcrR family transcriptional regulator [Burkholderia multivorans]PRE28503.1 TetR/AcrR family transcriptional regulator [Burkholderia multivorans]PRH24439.1 TetR/AcrR family transcriptional regulator [Burkholderia multivorans]